MALILNTLWKRALSCFAEPRNKGVRFMPRKNKSFPSCGSFSPLVSFAGGGGGALRNWFYFILFSFLLTALFSKSLRGVQTKSQKFVEFLR